MDGRLWTPKERLCIHLLQKPSTTKAPLLQIYGFILRQALHANLSLISKLISALSDPRHRGSDPVPGIGLARRIFDHHRRGGYDAFVCNSMIRAHAKNCQSDESLLLYKTLKKESSFAADSYTFPFLLKACASASVGSVGLQLYVHVIKMGLCSDVFVATGLIDMYAKRGEVGLARRLFDEMPVRSAASWTALIVGHARAGEVDSAVELFDLMPDGDRDTASFNAMVDIFSKLGEMEAARRIFHGMTVKNLISWTSMISGYCKNGQLDEARALFDEMPEKNLVSWNSMIGGYYQNKQPYGALELFREMQLRSSFEPDRVTILSVLPAIADLGALELGSWIHSYVRRLGLGGESSICTALIDMYAKCGEVKEALKLFDQMSGKELASWNAMINGLAVNGCAKEALGVFLDMENDGVKPNEITFIGVLSACSHAGLVEEGKKWFRKMEACGVKQRIEHCGCMVDLLGRAGLLKEAEELIDAMSCGVNGIVLSSLLFSCTAHGDSERGERMLKRAVELEPFNVGNYVMARNMYAGDQRWDDVEELKGMIGNKRPKKEAGCSSIEVNCRIWEFVAGDTVHPEWELIYGLLDQLWIQMKMQSEDNGPWT